VNLASILFRFRVAVLVLLHVIGFVAPWNYFTGGSPGTLWLAASTLIARSGWIGLATTTLTVTLLGLACLVTGTGLRVWGTAYLGSTVMRGTAMHGERLVAAGPYAYLRNPLYLGTWLIAVATSLLMPPDGAVFFLITDSGFLLFLITAEERFLAAGLGEPYQHYRRDVPRLLPHLSTQVPTAPAHPKWLRAVLCEIYPLGFTLCFAIFAWRYNARILIRCLLICYGLSLVMRAVNGTVKDTTAPNPSN
jgi:protein-S-isoprenylcysteine O-methyltransferase Ste14